MIKAVGIGAGVGLLAAFIFGWSKLITPVLGGAVAYAIFNYEIPKVSV
jgi:hypothetical protein